VNARYRALVTEHHELRRRFHEQLDEIDARVIRLFARVTEAIAAATEAFLAGDTESARKLVADDTLLDQLESDIEHVAERELLTQQPMARDMRYLVSVLRVVPELERSGDLAEHIASRAVTTAGATLTPGVRGLLEQMGATCVDMWRAAADAWADRDPDTAQALDEVDDRLDRLHDDLVEELLRGELPLAAALQITLVGRFYERLGDHAVHISERVRYLATGT
jgi:phosphate transport system protein